MQTSSTKTWLLSLFAFKVSLQEQSAITFLLASRRLYASCCGGSSLRDNVHYTQAKMLPTVEESLVSLFDSASFLDSLPFQATKGRIADTALAPAEVFEGTYVRDAEEHELGLFSTEDSSSHDGLYAAGAGSSSSIDHHSVRERDDRARHRRSLLGRSTGRSSTSRSGGHLGSSASTSHNAWHFPKSRGPARIGAPEKATPLKKRRAQPAQNNNVVDPEAYLLAARKLLQT